MVYSNNVDFHRHREGQERAMALRTGDPDARRAHLDLAERYALMIALKNSEARPILLAGIADRRGAMV